MQTKIVNVNELADILKKHFGYKWVYIESVNAGGTIEEIERKHIGAGGVLTIEFKYE